MPCHRPRRRGRDLARPCEGRARGPPRRRPPRPRAPHHRGRRHRDRDRQGREPRGPGTHPPRRRPRPRRGRQGALPRRAGHHRPCDRGRLLLRLRPRRALHAGRPRGDGGPNARDRRAQRAHLPRGSGTATTPSATSNRSGEHYKAEIIRDLPDGEEITIYRQGAFVDLCRGPHLPSTGKLGTAFKLTPPRRRLLAGRFTEPDAPARLRHGLAYAEGARRAPRAP